jgi:hypothetical protein
VNLNALVGQFSEHCQLVNVGGRKMCKLSHFSVGCDGSTHPAAPRQEARSKIWPDGAADVRDLARPFLLPTTTHSRTLIESRRETRRRELEREYGIAFEAFVPLQESEADKNARVLAEGKSQDLATAHRLVEQIVSRAQVNLDAAHALVAERLERR